jgi:hypothetical protein
LNLYIDILKTMFIKYLIDDGELRSYFGNMKYQLGLNTNDEEFIPDENCGNGLYFTKFGSENEWFVSADEVVYEVELVGHVVEEGGGFKAHSLILVGRINTVKEYIEAQGGTYITDFDAVVQNELALKYIKKQTPELCLTVVNRDGELLKYVEERNPEICLAAVKHVND